MTRVDPPHTPRPLPEPHGHGLRLCRWNPESDADVADWLRGTTDPEFLRWNTPLKPVTDLDSARAVLRAKADRDADGTSASFRITDAESGTTLGHIGVNEITHVFDRALIGYWVLPEARGHGVATRALRLAAHWAFTELGLHRLELDHAVGHDISCRVAERCGFRAEGVLRGGMWEAGRQDTYRDAHLHARLATDPEVDLP
ncbi:GNAT family N-acetyltransferase [Streptomyces sp. HUAS ZL42]|uniref:GNAT family N-acetyltransferase n=1 Tax=Streptomyces sp. HUAS ZL42 TaxID=3231715 RepID=UPI00345EC874